MKVTEKRTKRCLACKGKQASHKCYVSWVEDQSDGRGSSTAVIYTCPCPKCKPPVGSALGSAGLLRF